MEERYKIFDETLAALHKAGALSELVLIGSWCQHIYKYAFDDPAEIPALITSDIDFLIPHSPRIAKDVNVPDVLSGLGFEMVFSPVEHYAKYIRRELEVEFLVPEIGRGFSRPRVVKELHVNAQGLRYLSMLQEHSETIIYNGIPVTLVRPETFVLHKFLISGRRRKAEKREKDLASAVQLGEYLAQSGHRVSAMKKVLDSIHPKWKSDILNVIKEHSSKLYEMLNNP